MMVTMKIRTTNININIIDNNYHYYYFYSDDHTYCISWKKFFP